jgi:hypothetical protein
MRGYTGSGLSQHFNTLGTGYLNCLYAYKRKSASPVLNVLSDTEKAAQNALKSMCTNFLGNHKLENCREIVSEML